MREDAVMEDAHDPNGAEVLEQRPVKGIMVAEVTDDHVGVAAEL